MTYTSALANDPLFVGFDRIFDRMHTLNRIEQNQVKYPPYNIIKTDDNHYEVEMAIAGFTQDDLDITVEDGVMTIVGSKEQEDDTEYLHKGIGTRSFKRTFTLADTIVVQDAELKDGILHVHLENVIPDEKKPRKITISRPTEATLLTE
jgi:molecular chaperone IbpA